MVVVGVRTGLVETLKTKRNDKKVRMGEYQKVKFETYRHEFLQIFLFET